MLEVPGMVAGLQELITDPEPSVVKRTIRVFTNVYRHSLSLLASGELDPVKYEKSYSEVSGVSNQLIGLLKTAENEGIVVHLVRYLEAALVSHILSDLSKYPHIAKMTAPMLKKGVDALLELVNTPYVGGSAFCVAIRALFTVACYQVDMRSVVTNVAESLINSPPPNLFDHNVRSFHKTLQRNLFRLLKRADDNLDKERLIDLMVKVGVPRKRLWEWAPKVPRKRPAPISMEDRIIYGRLSPPSLKRARISEIDIIRYSPPSGSTSILPTIIPSIPMERMSTSNAALSSFPKPKSASKIDAAAILDQILSGAQNINNSLKGSGMNSPQDGSEKEKISSIVSKLRKESGRSPPFAEVSNVLTGRSQEQNSLPDSKENSPDPRCFAEPLHSSRNCSPPNSRASPPTTDNSKLNSSNEMLNLLNSAGKLCKTSPSSDTPLHFLNRCSSQEKVIYDRLTAENVVDLILNSVPILPKDKPKYIPLIKLEELDIMREKLAIMFSLYFKNEASAGELATTNKYSLATVERSSSNLKLDHDFLEKSLNSSGADNLNPLFACTDVDLRRPLNAAHLEGINSNYPVSSRDPRTRVSSNQSSVSINSDPRLQSLSSKSTPPMSDVPRLFTPDTTSPVPFSRDPRLQAPLATSSTPFSGDPRLQAPQATSSTPISGDPRLQAPPSILFINNDPRVQKMSTRDPRALLCRSPPMHPPLAPPPMFVSPPPSFSSAVPNADAVLAGNNFSYPLINALGTRVETTQTWDGNSLGSQRRSELYNNNNFNDLGRSTQAQQHNDPYRFTKRY